MESEDLPSSFSTLNVNAIEFIPNFGAPAAPTAKEPETKVDDGAKPVAEVPENNGNGESYANYFDVFKRRKFCHIERRRGDFQVMT